MINMHDLVASIKSAVPIVTAAEFLGVDFASKSGNNWMAHCPSHSDSDASLSFNPEKNVYFCFSTGCQMGGGDVISLYMHWFNIDFNESIRRMAVEWGLATEADFEIGSTIDPKRRLVHASLCVFDDMRDFLLRDVAAAAARKYVTGRGVSLDTLKEFSVGFSPSLQYAMKTAAKHGMTQADAVNCQFNNPKLFGARLVFPIIDPRRVGAFTYGGVVDRTKTTSAKYVGASNAHPLRYQGAFFGLQIARQNVRAAKTLLLVEGFMDCLVLHSKGFNNTAAALGSNPTKDQFDALRAINVHSVTTLFDGDVAGNFGAAKAVENAGAMRVYIASLETGVDPDEFVISSGVDALKSIIEQAEPRVSWLIGQAVQDFESGDVYAKTDRFKVLLAAIKNMPQHEAAIACAEVGKLTGLSTEAVTDLLNSVDTTLERPEESERVVLAGAMQDVQAFMAADLRIGTSNVFSQHRHKAVWDGIVAARKKNAELLTPELLQEEIGDKLKISDLLAVLETQPASNYEYHLDATCNAAVRRSLQAASKQLFGDAANTGKKIQEIVGKHMQSMSLMSATQGQIEFTAQQQVKSAMDYLHNQIANEGKVPGINLGPNWTAITDATLGLQKNQFIIVSAAPKVGKSTLCANWAVEVAVNQNIPVTIFNFEMSERDCALRILSIISGVSATRIRRGAIAAKEKAIIDEAAVRYHAAPLTIINAIGMNVFELSNAMRKAVYSDGAQLLIADYLQLINTAGSDKMAAWEKHVVIADELKNTASRLPVPLLCVAQQNKTAIMEGGGSLQMGGSIRYAQNCDLALSLTRRSEKDMQTDGMGTHDLAIDLSRSGPSDVTARLLMNYDNLRLAEV